MSSKDIWHCQFSPDHHYLSVYKELAHEDIIE